MENHHTSDSVAKVALLNGEALVRHADGAQAALRVGDTLVIGDVVITSPNAHLQIAISGGGVLHLSKDASDVIAIDQSVFDALSDVQNVSASADSFNILLANHLLDIDGLGQHGAETALNIADMLTDSDLESSVLPHANHKVETSKLSAVEAVSIDPTLVVHHWNHIDT